MKLENKGFEEPPAEDNPHDGWLDDYFDEAFDYAEWRRRVLGGADFDHFYSSS